MHVIYVDVLFLINCVMDICIFTTVTLVLNVWLPRRRHVVAALLASALYCIGMLCPVVCQIPYSILALWIPVIPVLYLYRPLTCKSFIKYYLASMMIAALFGGAVFNVWFIIGNGLKEITTMSMGLLFGISFGVTACFYGTFYWLRRCLVLRHYTYQIDLVYKGRHQEITALLDTGNLLYTPVTHRPVIVVTYKAVESLLTSQQCKQLQRFFNKQENFFNDAAYMNKEIPELLIPYHSVGCQSDFLWGLNIDEVQIMCPTLKKKSSACIIGISKTPLFSDGAYDALLHPEYILEGEMAV